MDINKFSKDNTCLIKDKYKSWESKGILLALILYLCRKQIILLNKRILVNSKEIAEYLQYLFNDMIFTDKEPNFIISVKNSFIGNLNIGNLNNINNIQAKKIYVVPFFDVDNPIVMYKLYKKKTQDIERIKEKITIFSDCNRKDWDSKKEIEIYNLYNKLYNKFRTINELNNYVDYNCGNIIYRDKFITKYSEIPMPYIMPSYMNNFRNNSKTNNGNTNSNILNNNINSNIINKHKQELNNIQQQIINNTKQLELLQNELIIVKQTTNNELLDRQNINIQSNNNNKLLDQLNKKEKELNEKEKDLEETKTSLIELMQLEEQSVIL